MTTDPFFCMTVEEILSISMRGTVVTGKIEQGTLNVGDEVAAQGKKRGTKNNRQRHRGAAKGGQSS